MGAGSWPTVLLSVLSTPGDFAAERAVLRETVFPHLRDRLRAMGCGFWPVDLRYDPGHGDQALDPAREAEVLTVCLEELDRTRPLYLGLLGDHYGWVPPKPLAEAAGNERGVPFDTAGRSVTGIEIEHGVLTSFSGGKGTLFFYREALPQSSMAESERERFRDPESGSRSRLADLKKRLEVALPDRVKSYTATWDPKAAGGFHVKPGEAFATGIEEALWPMVEAQARLLLDREAGDAIAVERQAQEKFSADRVIGFVGRDRLVEKLQAFALGATGSGPSGLVLTGPATIGKSAILARLGASLPLARRDGDGPMPVVLYHATEGSPRGRGLGWMLARWCEDLAQALAVPSPGLSDAGLPALRKRFRSLLATCSAERPVVLLLDDPQDLIGEEAGAGLGWLARPWPRGVRLICAAQGPAAERLAATYPELEKVDLPPLTEGEAETLALNVAQRGNCALSPELMRGLLDHGGGKTPAHQSPGWVVHAVTALVTADRSEAGEQVGILGAQLRSLLDEMPADMAGLLDWRLARGVAAGGPVFGNFVLSMLAVAPQGLRESDLALLLRRRPGRDAPREWDFLAFARLRRSARGLLTRDGAEERWRYVDRSLQRQAEARLITSREMGIGLARLLLEHLRELPVDDPVRLAETPRQAQRAGASADMLALIIDPNLSPTGQQALGASVAALDQEQGQGTAIGWSHALLLEAKPRQQFDLALRLGDQVLASAERMGSAGPRYDAFVRDTAAVLVAHPSEGLGEPAAAALAFLSRCLAEQALVTENPEDLAQAERLAGRAMQSLDVEVLPSRIARLLIDVARTAGCAALIDREWEIAADAYGWAVDMCDGWAAEAPLDSAPALSDLAALLLAHGEVEGCDRLLAIAMESLDVHLQAKPNDLEALGRRVRLQAQQAAGRTERGDAAGGDKELAGLVAFLDRLLESYGQRPEWLELKAECWSWIADAREVLGDAKGQRQAVEKATAIAGGLVALDPGNPVWRQILAGARERQVSLMWEQGEAEPAARLMSGVRAMRAALAKDLGPAANVALAATLNRLVLLHLAAGDAEAAGAAASEASALQADLLDNHPLAAATAGFRFLRGQAERALAATRLEPEPAARVPHLQRAQGVCQAMVARAPELVEPRRLLARTLESLAANLEEIGQAEPAVEILRRAEAMRTELSEDGATPALYARDLAICRATLAAVLERRGETEEADAIRAKVTLDVVPTRAEPAPIRPVADAPSQEVPPAAPAEEPSQAAAIPEAAPEPGPRTVIPEWAKDAAEQDGPVPLPDTDSKLPPTWVRGPKREPVPSRPAPPEGWERAPEPAPERAARAEVPPPPPAPEPEDEEPDPYAADAVALPMPVPPAPPAAADADQPLFEGAEEPASTPEPEEEEPTSEPHDGLEDRITALSAEVERRLASKDRAEALVPLGVLASLWEERLKTTSDPEEARRGALECRLRLAHLCLELGDRDTAVSHLEWAKSSLPEAGAHYPLIAARYHELEGDVAKASDEGETAIARYGEALRDLEAVDDKMKDQAAARRAHVAEKLGDRLRRSANPDKALEAYTLARESWQALTLGPKGISADALAARARLAASIATVHRLRDDRDALIGALKEAIAAWTAFLDIQPGRTEALISLGDAHYTAGALLYAQREAAEAVGHLEKCVLYREQYLKQAGASGTITLDVARAHGLLGEVQLSRGSAGPAATTLGRALALLDPADATPVVRRERAHLLLAQGNARKAAGDSDAALASFEEARGALAPALKAGEIEAIREAAALEAARADALRDRQRRPEAIVAFREAVGHTRALLKADPGNEDLERDLCRIHGRMALTLREEGDAEGARKVLEEELDILLARVEAKPDDRGWRAMLAQAYGRLGEVMRSRRAFTDALAAFHRGIGIMETLSAEEPDKASWRHELAASHGHIGMSHYESRNLDAALAAFQTALDLREKLVAEEQDNPRNRREIAILCERIADVHFDKAQFDAAQDLYGRALEESARLSRGHPRNERLKRELAYCHAKVGSCLKARKKLPEALEAFQAGMAIIAQLADGDRDNLAWQRDMARFYLGLADTREALGETAEAAALRRTAATIRQKLEGAAPERAAS